MKSSNILTRIIEFESDTNRVNFTFLQVENFYESLAGMLVRIEGIIENIKKDSLNKHEIVVNVINYKINDVYGTRQVIAEKRWILHFNAAVNHPSIPVVTGLIRNSKVVCEGTFEKPGYPMGTLFFKLVSIQPLEMLQSDLDKKDAEQQVKVYQENLRKKKKQETYSDNVRMMAILCAFFGACGGAVLGFLIGAMSNHPTMFSSALWGFLLCGILGALFGAIIAHFEL